MKRLLVDANVVLDVLLDRQRHAERSIPIWVSIETGRCEGYLSAHAITTIHYLIQRELGAAKAKQLVALMLRMFRVAAVDGLVIQQALGFAISDFEDAVTAAAGQACQCDFIVSRNLKGFRGSPVQALAPEAALPMLEFPS